MSSRISAEFAGVDLKDQRLNRRALSSVERIASRPDASFPEVFGQKSAALEGFYRLVESPYIRSEALHAPHVAATLGRFGDEGDIVVAHDGSSFENAGARRLLSVSKQGEAGFIGHFSLALRESNHEPLGLVRMHTWLRPEETRTSLRKAGAKASEYQHLPSEMDHWIEAIRDVEALAPRPERLIHVCDSEADAYVLLAPLVVEARRFVIRGAYDRRIQGSTTKLHDCLRAQPMVAERQVNLSKRTKTKGTSAKTRNQPREQRTATLEIRHTAVTIVRPESVLASAGLPKAITVNAVHVVEPAPPEGCPPVEWILLTPESCASPEQILRVVDIYRARWKIEEFFKALKTGCAYESRQLESLDSLRNAMAIFAPIAWLMLHTRFLSRQLPEVPAEQVLPPDELQVLRLKTSKPLTNARDVLWAVASMGGHIKNNGDPGWLVLWRGMRHLLTLVEGVALARTFKELASERCDQS